MADKKISEFDSLINALQSNDLFVMVEASTGLNKKMSASKFFELLVLQTLTLQTVSPISGGGDLSTSRTLQFNINNLTEKTSPASADEFIIYSIADAGFRKLTKDNLLSGLTGALTPKGTWDASTNTPTLSSGVGTDGDLYIVSVAGTTTLDGVSDWSVGDSLFFASSQWNKVESNISVSSVFGRTGDIIASIGDYTASQITNVPSGGISATNVQDALNALDARITAGGVSEGLAIAYAVAL